MSVYEVGFDGDSARVVVEVSLLMVLMILFGTARVRLLENTFSSISSTKRTLGVLAC